MKPLVCTRCKGSSCSACGYRGWVWEDGGIPKPCPQTARPFNTGNNLPCNRDDVCEGCGRTSAETYCPPSTYRVVNEWTTPQGEIVIEYASEPFYSREEAERCMRFWMVGPDTEQYFVIEIPPKKVKVLPK